MKRYNSNPKCMVNTSSITNLTQQGEWGVSAGAYCENDVVKHIFQFLLGQRSKVACIMVEISNEKIANKHRFAQVRNSTDAGGGFQ